MKKIAVITGTRAEYGILKSVLRQIEANPKLNLSLIVIGMHLSAEFG
ncbi:MAG: UDP-N-acetylglucosamine 2-epimerase (hydrolyzing), partial [Candidatus Hermodarchaeota archaeon]